MGVDGLSEDESLVDVEFTRLELIYNMFNIREERRCWREVHQFQQQCLTDSVRRTEETLGAEEDEQTQFVLVGRTD